MRETRLSGSEGGAGQLNAPFLPLSGEPVSNSGLSRFPRFASACLTGSGGLRRQFN